MEKEAEHLLADEGGSQDGYHFADQLPYRRRSGLHSRLRDIPWKALLGSFLFTVFSLSAAMLVLRMTFGYEIIIRERTFSKDVDLMLYSPLHYPLQYETVPLSEGWESSIFFGEPSQESEHAWNKMLHPTGMRLSPAEAEQVGLNDNVVMPDGDIISVPAVMHNLHCLRRLRQTLQADYYESRLKEGEFNPEEDRYHTFHCLESMRHSIMCRADLTPLQFYWDNDTFHALKVRGVGEQTCLKWDSFETVRESRTYDRNELEKFHDHGY